MNCPEVRNVKDVILTQYKCLHNEKDMCIFDKAVSKVQPGNCLLS